MRAVSRFEANLVRLLHCLLHRAPVDQVLTWLLDAHERPKCLSRPAVELMQDALAKGCVLLLARQGGWRTERFLRGDRVVEARLWARTPPAALGLEFSQATPSFLLWLSETNLREEPKAWTVPAGSLALGDRLFLFFAYEALRRTEVAKTLRAQPCFAGHALCRLAYPEDFGETASTVSTEFGPWLEEPGPSLLEALQSRLAERWRTVERNKGGVVEPGRMRTLGEVQGRVLDAFLDGIDAAGRRDLARFLLEAASGLLRDPPPAIEWVGSLDVSGLRLAERAETYAAALAFLRRLDRLRQWNQEARAVGYFDDGYAASQLWKSEWERLDGETLWANAQASIQRLEPL